MSLSSTDAAGLVESIAAIHHTKPDTVDLFGTKKAIVVDGAITVYDDPKDAVPQTLSSTTLTAVVDFIKAGIAASDTSSKIVVHVVSPTEVNVVAPIVGDMRQRFTYLQSKPVRPDIRYGQYFDLETFVVQIQSMFADMGDRDTLLRFIGSIRVEKSVEMADNGVSQSVTAKAGVTRTEEVDVKNPWLLSPFRTFPEIEQPVSGFLLRLNKDAAAALFEADGGSWRVEAIASIGAWLRTELAAEEDVTVLA